jgi:hypothetical protein
VAPVSGEVKWSEGGHGQAAVSVKAAGGHHTHRYKHTVSPQPSAAQHSTAQHRTHLQHAGLAARVQEVPLVVHTDLNQGGGGAPQEGREEGGQQVPQASGVAHLQRETNSGGSRDKQSGQSRHQQQQSGKWRRQREGKANGSDTDSHDM